MSRRSAGFVGAWAEIQRQRQRRAEAEARQARARQRLAAQNHREQRQAEAGRRTEELEARTAALQAVLSAGCGAPAFRASSLMRAQALGAEARRHNAGIREAVEGVRRGEPDAVVEYFTAALYSSTAWPAEFPRQVAAAYDPQGRQLVLDWELPGYDVVPEAKSVRYVSATDQYKETARPVSQRRALYREVLAQSMLLVLHQLFAADEHRVLDSVALNGYVDARDPATGRQAHIFLATVMAPRAVFTELHLERVEAVSCLSEALRGQLATRPDQLTSAVRPGRQPQDVGRHAAAGGGDEEPDLYEMDPLAFESLVADLFRAMGMQAVTTQRSNDGGVDVDAVDPAPIRGGKIVVQVKRYRNTVPPTAVRDLYGTVQDVGANKGVLVTTSGFGPGSHTFVRGKPLELVSGRELVDLLHRHGLRGRLGEGGRPAPARPAPPAPAAAADDHNVLGLAWSGDVALDVCALVCHGNRVVGEDHFVFFNNPQTPDGSVRAVRAVAPDKAAMRVSFDALPAAADRFVLVAAVDPEVNPHADLSGFTDARIRLLDPAMTELGRLEVSDGRARETALVLGSFRRRAGGDWDFVLGGKGYTGGLEELVRDFGIDVE
ncbi:restriction endonuclease [Streptomyces sp. NPDC020490]|uniref:restriction endonuclease n=1 Tax=Streptomyces sp. NPDC020490 TaxID=3365078 RepID=UPI00378F148B